MTKQARGQPRDRPTGKEPDPASTEPTSFLIARANASQSPGEPGLGIRLRFKIQHMMWLSLWTAVVLAVREPLVESLPLAVEWAVWGSGGLAAAMVVGLYGIALLMPEGTTKDDVVLALLYFLAGDTVLFLVVLLLGGRR